MAFADPVSFTELSHQLSERELTELVGRFESRTSGIAIAVGGRVIKSLGDEILYVADEPATAVTIAFEFVQAISRTNLPGIRVGLEHGSVIHHAGDVFGDTVNLASRLTAMAEPNHILVGPALAEFCSATRFSG